MLVRWRPAPDGDTYTPRPLQAGGAASASMFHTQRCCLSPLIPSRPTAGAAGRPWKDEARRQTLSLPVPLNTCRPPTHHTQQDGLRSSLPTLGPAGLAAGAAGGHLPAAGVEGRPVSLSKAVSERCCCLTAGCTQRQSCGGCLHGRPSTLRPTLEQGGVRADVPRRCRTDGGLLQAVAGGFCHR